MTRSAATRAMTALRSPRYWSALTRFPRFVVSGSSGGDGDPAGSARASSAKRCEAGPSTFPSASSSRPTTGVGSGPPPSRRSRLARPRPAGSSHPAGFDLRLRGIRVQRSCSASQMEAPPAAIGRGKPVWRSQATASIAGAIYRPNAGREPASPPALSRRPSVLSRSAERRRSLRLRTIQDLSSTPRPMRASWFTMSKTEIARPVRARPGRWRESGPGCHGEPRSELTIATEDGGDGDFSECREPRSGCRSGRVWS